MNTVTPHADHRGINGRGYRLRGCMECELRYRMAWRDADPPDSAVESMAFVAWGIASWLLIILWSSWMPGQPTP